MNKMENRIVRILKKIYPDNEPIRMTEGFGISVAGMGRFEGKFIQDDRTFLIKQTELTAHYFLFIASEHLYRVVKRDDIMKHLGVEFSISYDARKSYSIPAGIIFPDNFSIKKIKK